MDPLKHLQAPEPPELILSDARLAELEALATEGTSWRRHVEVVLGIVAELAPLAAAAPPPWGQIAAVGVPLLKRFAEAHAKGEDGALGEEYWTQVRAWIESIRSARKEENP
ncbi:MAG: hypothetical protein HUU16_00095 [Candidatus Omnitrophica bacterium]|nr:hypothetical protein [Candidatus Omnitrophota bacterium]